MPGLGERVTGVPANPYTRKKYPTVTGYYDRQKVEFLGEEHIIEYVKVGKSDVDCENIRPAARREKDTVFK